MNIFIENTVDELKIDSKTEKMLKEIAIKTLKYEEFGEDFDLNINIVSAEEIRRLNSEFRGIDKVTDVLSFPQYDEDGSFVSVDNENFMLGDVVLCYERALEQSIEFGHTLDRELSYLTCHSILHLLGYDHVEEKEKKEMRAIEKAIMGDV